jgi:microsomal epoxide hydrolase
MKSPVALAWSLTLACSLLAAPASARNDTSPAIRANVVTLPDGTQIHCLEAGELNAVPALVLIPGWTLPAFLWNEQLRKFSADRLVIAIDPRSQGDSSKSDANNTPEQRARDLREILSKRRISQAVLVGWSQGAQDVAAYLQQFGSDGLAGVVFVDSPVSGGASELESNREFSQGLLRRLASFVERPEEYRAGLVRSLFKRPHPELQADELIAHVTKTPVSTAVTMLVMDLLTLDRRPALARLDKPTLVIASADSDLLEAQKSMAAAVPGAQFVAVPETGHAVFVDDPTTFDRALQGLLDSAVRAKKSTS